MNNFDNPPTQGKAGIIVVGVVVAGLGLAGLGGYLVYSNTSETRDASGANDSGEANIAGRWYFDPADGRFLGFDTQLSEVGVRLLVSVFHCGINVSLADGRRLRFGICGRLDRDRHLRNHPWPPFRRRWDSARGSRCDSRSLTPEIGSLGRRMSPSRGRKSATLSQST